MRNAIGNAFIAGVVAACATASDTSDTPAALVQTDDAYTTTGERAAPGLTSGERDRPGEQLADKLPWDNELENAPDSLDILRKLDWRNSSHGRRLRVLKYMAVHDSDWALDVLQRIEAEALSDEAIADLEDDYFSEVESLAAKRRMEQEINDLRAELAARRGDEAVRRFTESDYDSRPQLRSRADNGAAPMPFGRSMFGPWDTGRGPEAP